MSRDVLTITSAELISPKSLRWNKHEKRIDNNELIVKLLYWGVCSSDCKTFNQGEGKYFGHEMVGEIIQGNEYYNVGALVVPFHSNVNNEDTVEFNRNLGFSDYLCVAPSQFDSIFKIPDTHAPERYVFLDSISCVLHALRISDIYRSKNLNILILGTGFMANLFADILGLNSNNIAFSSRKEMMEDIERKFDLCIDTTGSNQFINTHLKNISERGLLLCFCKPDTASLNLNEIRSKEIKLQYSRFCNREDVISAIELISSNQLNLEKYIMNYSERKDLERAFMDFNNKLIIRGVIRVEEGCNEDISI